jgi:hypothetical protein
VVFKSSRGIKKIVTSPCGCRRKNKSYRRINRLAKGVSHLASKLRDHSSYGPCAVLLISADHIYGPEIKKTKTKQGPEELWFRSYHLTVLRQGVWGKWCKILHSSLLLASNLLPKILDSFLDIFNKHS